MLDRGGGRGAVHSEATVLHEGAGSTPCTGCTGNPFCRQNDRKTDMTENITSHQMRLWESNVFIVGNSHIGPKTPLPHGQTE